MNCFICRQVRGETDVPGGVIYETAKWFVDHTTGFLGLGTLVVKPKRHVVRLSDLTEDEASELGPCLRLTARLVRDVVPADQVYTCLWSHGDGVPQHIHFVLQPVTNAERLRRGGGARLQVALFDERRPPDGDAAALLADRAREILADQRQVHPTM